MLFNSYKTFRNVILAIVTLLAIAFLIAHIALIEIEKQVREDIGNALEIVVQSTQESLIIWVENHKEFLKQLSKDTKLISLVHQHLEVSRTPQELLDSQSLKELREFFDTRRDKSEDIGFFIITPDYINIASMRNDNIGITNLIAEQRPELLKKAFNGETVFVLPVHSDVPLQHQSLEKPPTIFFATPIKTKDEVLAVLTLRFVPNQDLTRLTQIGRIGKSGETYAFDKSGLLISNSRFNEDLLHIGLLQENEEAILNVRVSDPGGNMLEGYQPSVTQAQQPLTLMAKNVISENGGVNVQGYRDYRGVTVLGAWLWNSDLGFGLTTEIDKNEALETFYSTKKIVLGVVSITLFLSLSLALVIFWLEQRANTILRKYRDELEDKVKERTVELEDSYQTIKKQKNKIEKDLEDARETQRNLLPKTYPSIAKVKICCKFSPMEQIGGDFYDIFPLDENHYGLMIADVTGHGPSAALISFAVSAIFNEARKSELSSKIAITLTNKMLDGKLPNGKFASMFYGIYDEKCQTLTYTNGGHPYSLLLRPSSKKIINLNTNGHLVGILPSEDVSYEEKKIQLQTGDKIILYTDAIVEAKNMEGKMLGSNRLMSYFKTICDYPIYDLIEATHQFGLDFSESSQFNDDCTLVGIEIIDT